MLNNFWKQKTTTKKKKKNEIDITLETVLQEIP